jgi:type II secretory pathway component PulF
MVGPTVRGILTKLKKVQKGEPYRYDFWVKKFFSSFLLKMIRNGQKTTNIDVLSDYDHYDHFKC